MRTHVSATPAGTGAAVARPRSCMLVAAALCVICLLGSACGLPYDGSPKALPGALPAALTSPDPTVPSTTLPREGAIAELYFVQNSKLNSFQQIVRIPLTVDEVLSNLEGAPPSLHNIRDEGAPVSSALPSGSNLKSLGVVKGVAHIALDSEFEGLESPQALLELGQIVYSLIQTTMASPEGKKHLGITAVKFYFNGSPVDAENATGEVVTGEVTEADYCSETASGCPIPRKISPAQQ